MKLACVFSSLLIVCSASVYWNIGWRNPENGNKLYLSSDARFYLLRFGWVQYWKKIKETTVDGITFFSLQNQYKTDKVLDVHNGCEMQYQFKVLDLWPPQDGFPPNQMFSYLDNGTLISACKNKNGQYKVVIGKAHRLYLEDPSKGVGHDEKITFTYYAD